MKQAREAREEARERVRAPHAAYVIDDGDPAA